MNNDGWKCLHCSPAPLHTVIEARNWYGTIERRLLVTQEDLHKIEWWDFTHWRLPGDTSVTVVDVRESPKPPPF